MSIKPIVLKIESIDDDNLIQENGYEANVFLSELRKVIHLMSERNKFIQFQYMNFQIKTPISTLFIKPYYVEYVGEIGKENFNYTLKPAYN